MKIYRKIFEYVPEMKIMGILSIFLSFFSALITCIGYYMVFKILESLIIIKDFNLAEKISIEAILLLTIGASIYFISGLFSHKLGFRLETNMRKKGIEGIANSSFKFFDTNESGVVRKLIDDNATMTHMAVAHMIPDMGQAFITPAITLILAFIISLKLGSVLVITIITGSVFMAKMMSGRDKPFLKYYQEALKKLSGETVEYIRGIQVVKIFNAQIYSFRSLYKAIMDYSDYAYKYSLSCRIPYVIYQWIFIGTVLIIIMPVVIYAHLIKNPYDVFIGLVMYVLFTGVILVSIMRIMYAGQYMFNANYAIENLENLYNEMLKDKLVFGNEKEVNNYNITFDNVTFSYGDKKIFNKFNLKLEEKKSYALVGSSGSGKSTLAKLLSGFYKVDGGSIKLGNKSIDCYSEETVIKSISFVFQDPKLFKTTIYENVSIAKENASRDEVLKALHDACCDDILDKLKDRENTVIGSKGVYLSGGEKQRIAIARAILKDSPVVIMDEASASIDSDNEYKLQESFKKLMKDRTVIMIAHRLSSIKNVDEIIVLDNGNIVEKGSHSELIKSDGEYKKLLELYYRTNDWRLNNEKVL